MKEDFSVEGKLACTRLSVSVDERKKARDPLRTPLEQAKGKRFSHVLINVRFF